MLHATESPPLRAPGCRPQLSRPQLSRRALALLVTVLAGLLLLLTRPGGPAAPVLSGALCSALCRCAGRPWGGLLSRQRSDPVTSNCGPTADRRGPGQNVIAFTFFGADVTAYLSGVARNAERAQELYPGWTVRVYHDGAARLPAWNATACHVTCRFPDVDFCDVRRLPGLGDISQSTPTVWRVAVLADPSVERFLQRDLDSVLSEREKIAVEEWLRSNKTFHIMRDHQGHPAEILAGMWGGWNRYNHIYGPIQQKILADKKPYTQESRAQDQELLKTFLWPELLRTGDVIAHDSFWCRKYPCGTQPWPSQRQHRLDFVGARLTRNETSLVNKCPVTCRPPGHTDWTYC